MFCPRCGATSAPESTFCERCGERLGAEGPAPVLPPAGAETPTVVAPAAAGYAPAPPGGGGRRGWWIGGVIVVVAVVVGVLAVAGVFGGKDPAQRVARATVAVSPTPTPATTPAPATEAVPSDTTPTTTETETTATTPDEPEPVDATVARTCGVDGSGDCHLSVRAHPSGGASELRQLDEGDAVRLTCQVEGDAVTSSALGASSTVWSRTSQGGYVSNVYVKGPGLKPTRRTLPAC